MEKREWIFQIIAWASILAAVLALALFVTACGSSKPVVASENKTENRLANARETITDSIYLFKHDSVFVRDRGDTVFVDRWRCRIEYRAKTDTVYSRDSIYINRDLVQVSEVNRLTGWQNFQVWLGRILISLLVLTGVYLFIKQRLKW